MTSFEDTLAVEKSSQWKKDSTLVVKPESLQFTTDTSLKSRALGFAQLLLQDTGLSKTKNKLSPSKPTNDDTDVEEAKRDSRDLGGQGLDQKKQLPEGEATASENSNEEDIEEFDVGEPVLQQKNLEDFPKQGSEDDETSFDKKVVEPTFSQKDLDKAISEARREGVEEGFKNGEKAGREDGIAETEMRLNEPLKKAQNDFEEFVKSINKAISDKEFFFAPLKRLAMHLAQEIAKSEIKSSDVAINKLVENCLSELGTAKRAKITVSLHPGDLSSYKKHIHRANQSDIEVKTDESLSSGSVRVSVNESIVEDLIENRIKKLSLTLLGDQREVFSKAESRAAGNTQSNQHEKKQELDDESRAEVQAHGMSVKEKDMEFKSDENQNSVEQNSEPLNLESKSIVAESPASNSELVEMPENFNKIAEGGQNTPSELGTAGNTQNNQYEKKEKLDDESEAGVTANDMPVRNKDMEFKPEETKNSIEENSESSNLEINSIVAESPASNSELAAAPEELNELVEARQDTPRSYDATTDTPSVEISAPKKNK